MENSGIKTIAILGGDCVAWSVAAILCRCSGVKSLRVVVIDTEDSVPAGEIKAMNPSLQKFHKLIGVDERDFMSSTGASFRLANRYQYGENPQQAFFQSFGEYGAPFNDVDFHQHFTKVALHPVAQAYHWYSLGAVAAKREKFLLPAVDARSIYSSFSYGYHLDAGLYRNYLRERGLAWGVEQVVGRYNNSTRCEKTGFLRSLVLDNGHQVEADFFIDCSGSEGMLIDKALNVRYEAFDNYIPVKHHTDMKIPYSGDAKLSTLWRYKNNLWRKEIFSGDSRFIRLFSSSVVEDEAVDIVQTSGGLEGCCKEKKVNPGMRKFIWDKNCLSAGSSCAYLGEFGVDELELSHFIAIKFLDFFPDIYCRPLNTAEFNRVITRECENIRDYNTLHYYMAYKKLAYEPQATALRLSPELENNLDMFADSGIRTGSNDNLISRQQWIAYLMEHEFLPRQPVLLASLAGAELSQRFAHLRGAIENAANAMPEQKEYLQQYLSRSSS